MVEDIKPRGRPKKNSKYTWQVTSEGIIPVEVRFHQGNYKTFKYENGKTTMLKNVNTPLFNSLEEANSNAPKFEGFTKPIKDTRGAPRQFPGKYGYTITPDNKIIIEEYRFFTGSGTAKEGYRNVSFDEKGTTTKGKLFDGELFDTPNEAINNYQTNYSNGKLIDWEAFEQSQADIAAREPSPEQLEEYNRSQEFGDFSDEDIARLENNVDEVTGVKGAGSKALKIVSKLGWADDLAIKAIGTQIPKLFAGTMLAGAAGTVGSGIVTALAVWSTANLALAAVRGAGTFAKEYGGDTLAALDAIASGEIPEKTFGEAAKESFFEGAGEFGEQMQYDPFVMTIDKGFEMASGGRMQGQEDVFLKPISMGWNAIKNNMVNPQSKYQSSYLGGNND